MVDQWELASNARALQRAFAELHHLKMGVTHAPQQERIMASTPGPRTPSGDGDNALNIEMELLRDTTDDDIPGGLFNMTRDALNHTGKRTIILTRNGIRCAANIFSAAMEIAENFPEADALNDLLIAQEDYLGAYIAKNRERIHGQQQHVANEDPYLTAGSIQRSLATRDLTCPEGTIRRWASEGKVKTRAMGKGRTTYRLADVLAALDLR